MEISYLSARQLIDCYKQKALSPVDVVDVTLERIERLNPIINAVYAVDRSNAISAARKSEARWLKGEPMGLFDGVPTTIKDALPAVGLPAFRGSAANDVAFSKEDHPSVARLREAGAIILGRNTMCDYGIIASGVSSKHGVTRNPWNIEKNTGASSSGAAATIAAGINPISIGTDIVGSIRLPASYCGLVGHKPSRGRVPYYFPNHPAITAGPMARNVRDAAMFLDVLSLPDQRDFTALNEGPQHFLTNLDLFDPSAKKAVLLLDLGFGITPSNETQATVRKAARQLEAVGLKFETTITSAPFSSDADTAAHLHYKVRCFNEFKAVDTDKQNLSPIIQDWTQNAQSISADQFYTASMKMLSLQEEVFKLMGNADFLLLPSTPIPAHNAEEATPDPSDLFAPWCNNFLFNLTGQPAISINCGFTQSGLPIGLQIVGRSNNDLGVLQLARLYERISDTQPDWTVVEDYLSVTSRANS
mgnify:CR=1 FL=1